MYEPTAPPAGTVMLETATCSVGLDPSVGNLPHLAFTWQGQTYAPLHRAPWIDDASFPDQMPLVDRALSGDFVCVPFGKSDVEPSPPHGWSANSAWRALDGPTDRLTYELERKIMGAKLTKTIMPASDAPLLYQEHLVEGGIGGLTFAHHPMMRVAGGAAVFTSPKRLAVTPDNPIVEGRHALANGQAVADYRAVPATTGGTLDVSRLPIADGTEDFVAMAEDDGSALGWTVVIREDQNDIVFILKNPAVLPLTMLWHSNGGREDAPWSGRHVGVLGVEDGIAAGAAGHAAALGKNVFTRHGVPTALQLSADRIHRIAHVMGAIPRPDGWNAVQNVTIDGAELTLHGPNGTSETMPFAAGFLD